MKLKGLSKALADLDTLNNAAQEKLDSIEWSGDNDTKDQQRDEYYGEAQNLILNAKDALKEVKELSLDDF